MLVIPLTGIVNSLFGVCIIKGKLCYNLFLIQYQYWGVGQNLRLVFMLTCLHCLFITMCIPVCMYIYVYLYIHTYILIHIYIYISFSIYVHTCFCSKFISWESKLSIGSLFLWVKDIPDWFLVIIFLVILYRTVASSKWKSKEARNVVNKKFE